MATNNQPSSTYGAMPDPAGSEKPVLAAVKTQRLSDEELRLNEIDRQTRLKANAIIDAQIAAATNPSTQLEARNAIASGLANASESDSGKIVTERYLSRDFWEHIIISGTLQNEGVAMRNSFTNLMIEHFHDPIGGMVDETEMERIYLKITKAHNIPLEKFSVLGKIESKLRTVELLVQRKIIRLLEVGLDEIRKTLANETDVAYSNKTALETALNEFRTYTENTDINISQFSEGGQAIIRSFKKVGNSRSEVYNAAVLYEAHLREKSSIFYGIKKAFTQLARLLGGKS